MLTDINITVEQDLKNQAEEVFARIGLTMNEAMKYFLRASVSLNTLPPGIEEENFNSETLEALQEAEDIASGKVQAKSYHTLEEYKAEIAARILAEDKANA